MTTLQVLLILQRLILFIDKVKFQLDVLKNKGGSFYSIQVHGPLNFMACGLQVKNPCSFLSFLIVLYSL